MKRQSSVLVWIFLFSSGLAGCGSVSGGTDGGRDGSIDGGGSGGGAGAGGSGGSAGGSGGSGGTGGGGGCAYNGVNHPVGSSFPSSDGCNTCSCAAGGQVACTLRACAPDAGTDGSASCALDAAYRYGNTGGFVAYENEATLTPPVSYAYTRRPVRTDPADLTCTPALPPCNSAAAIDVADIRREIADPDVQRALAAPTPPIYGRDNRPADGTIFQFLRADGRGFLAGSACGTGAPACVAIPPGVARLVSLLRALDQQQLMDPTCAQLR